jgi:tetratricopeptide (TPR) repeat protein
LAFSGRPALTRFAAGAVIGAAIGFFAANAIDTAQEPAPAPVAAPARPAPPQPTLADEEIEGARAAVDARPGDFEAQFKFAEALLRISRKPREAIPYYERAAALAPRDPRPLVGLGDASFATALDVERTGGYDEALLEAAATAYERALALEPKSAGTRAALGLTYAMRRPPEHPRAIREFRAAIETDPANELALQGLATSLASTGDLKGAEEAVARLEAVDPRSPALAAARSAVERARGEALGK